MNAFHEMFPARPADARSCRVLVIPGGHMPPACRREIAAILDDAAASDWLKGALRAALTRDPIDAAGDAACLARLLQERANAALSVADGPSSDGDRQA